MAYIRQHGNQLVIVHGERDRDTGKVRQRVLFSFYSQAEALAALEDTGQARFLKKLLEDQYPDISFNWKRIWWEIARKLDILPETYEYRESKLLDSFRQDLCSATRQLILADPQWLASSASIIREHRYELEYLRDLIDWRLQLCGSKANEWTSDNAFLWRLRLRESTTSPEAEEQAEVWFERGEYERARAVFQFLIHCFPDYAEGYNYLGLIALEKGDLDGAESHFSRMLELLRHRLPRRMTPRIFKSSYKFRPYRRALNNLALAFIRSGRYDDGLQLCDKLEQEWGQRPDAIAHRLCVHLNRGEWKEAVEAAIYLRNGHPAESCLGALALFELGQLEDSMAFFLHGALNYPRTASMLVGRRLPPPCNHEEWRDQDMGDSFRANLGGFFSRQTARSRRFFRRLIADPKVSDLLQEVAEARRQRDGDRSAPKPDRYRKLEIMLSPAFACEKVPEIMRSLPI